MIVWKTFLSLNDQSFHDLDGFGFLGLCMAELFRLVTIVNFS